MFQLLTVVCWTSLTQNYYCFSHLFITQYKQNPEMFKQTARLWSHVYAGAPVSSPEYTRKIDKLCAMGFEKVSTSQLFPSPTVHCTAGFCCRIKLNGFCLSSQNAVIVALSSKSWDVETATELLLSNWILTVSSSSSWSLALPLTHTHPLSSKFQLSQGVFSPCWTLCFTVDSSPPRLPSSPPPLRIPFVWHLSFPAPLLYHTPISRSVSSYLWFLKFI